MEYLMSVVEIYLRRTVRRTNGTELGIKWNLNSQKPGLKISPLYIFMDLFKL